MPQMPRWLLWTLTAGATACAGAASDDDGTPPTDSAPPPLTTSSPSPSAPFPAASPEVDVVQAMSAYLEPDEAVDIDEGEHPPPYALPPADPSRWSVTYFRHQSYACARSGQQSFMVLNPPGAAWDEPLDLFVYLHGGGIGAFTDDGTYQPEWFLSEPCISMVDEEDPEKLFARWAGDDVCTSTWPPTDGLASALIEAADQRIVVASKCDHDTYGGEGTPDADNPWRPDNRVDGLLATMAAVELMFDLGATSPDHALTMGGASAGGVGVLTVSRALAATGRTVHGVVSDGAVMTDRLDDVFAEAPADCAFREQVADPALWRPRLGRVADSDQQPHLLLTEDHAPVFLSYSPADSTFCSEEAAEAVFADMADAVRAVDPGGVSEVRETCLDHDHGCNAHALIRWVDPDHRNTLRCDAAGCEPVLQTMVDWLDARRAEAR